MTEKEWLNDNELSLAIFNKKYRNENESLDEFFERVSDGNQDLKQLIIDKKFIFGGRILASRGITDRKVTYSNCYVITPPDDTIESIFECASKLARTYSYGGGCGIDLSNLRPNGAKVSNASKTSSGPVSFMDLFSQVTQTISQNGRRGALMISLDVNHPDIEEFIDCKTNLERVKYANISVKVNDTFMKAVEEDKDYILRWPCDSIFVDDLQEEFPCNAPYNELNKTLDNTGQTIGYYKRVKAKEIFNKLVKNNWDYAEPGILYWNKISSYNLLEGTDFKYAGVNPCAEEPLPAGGSCLLGSLNLSEFVLDPFTPNARIDYDALEKATYIAVAGLNDVLQQGIPLHPLAEQQLSVTKWRQIGLGTMGMADMLIKLGITYGSKESIEKLHSVYGAIATFAVEESLELAKNYGCYEGCDKEKLANCSFIKNLNLADSIIKDIKKFGLYNSQLLTCAPTGSIGTMLETSTGVEPNFALSYTRKTQSLDGKDTYYKVNAKIVEDYNKIGNSNTENLPEFFVTSATISPIDRVRVQSVLQQYTDASISSTVNLPKEATVEDVYNIYMEAWNQGLKGITIYRSGCKREGILTTDLPKPEEISNTKAPKRPKDLEADFYTIKSKGKQYIILVGLLNNKPYEIFAFEPNIRISAEPHKGIITKKSKMHYSFKSTYLQIDDLQLANSNVEERAATLYASMLLRHGVDIKYIIKTAKKVNDNISSFSSAMCRVLGKYTENSITGEKCPNCGADIINEGGCKHCSQCEWSKCE